MTKTLKLKKYTNINKHFIDIKNIQIDKIKWLQLTN